MLCHECENLLFGYPIKVVDYSECATPFSEEVYHFEDGYKCTWNGCEALTTAELRECGCRRVKKEE